MNVLIKGKEETIKFYRPDSSVSVSSISILNPSSGETVTTGIIDNDTTEESLLTSVSRGSSSVSCSNLSVNTEYELTTDTGKTLYIAVIGGSGDSWELSEDLPISINSATIKGIESTATLTVPSDYDEDSVLIEWTLDNGDLVSDEIITSKFKFYSPVKSSDLYIRWSRTKNNEPSYQSAKGEEWQPQINRAVEIIRERFWLDNKILDHIRAPKQLKELILFQTALIIVNMGIDLSASNDPKSVRDDISDQLKTEYDRVLSASNLWRDSDEDGIKTETEQTSIRWIRY